MPCYPLDGVVLTTGCDKTSHAHLTAAASVSIAAIALCSGDVEQLLRGQADRFGAGHIRIKTPAGKINYAEFIERIVAPEGL
jgi:dihydroxyacid dehydratase/phosphogluconate dehydratase